MDTVSQSEAFPARNVCTCRNSVGVTPVMVRKARVKALLQM